MVCEQVVCLTLSKVLTQRRHKLARFALPLSYHVKTILTMFLFCFGSENETIENQPCYVLENMATFENIYEEKITVSVNRSKQTREVNRHDLRKNATSCFFSSEVVKPVFLHNLHNVIHI